MPVSTRALGKWIVGGLIAVSPPSQRPSAAPQSGSESWQPTSADPHGLRRTLSTWS